MGNDNSRHRHRHHGDLTTGGGGEDQLTIKDESTIKPQRRMDKLRRSLSFRRSKASKKEPKNSKSATTTTTTNAASSSTTTGTGSGGTERPTSWQDDERKVRDGSCSFHVKYLGSIEVADSRGMEICEQAIEKLLLEKKKPIKAILYVSGDALRVVDESNKTLLVDQTIEKVSFCAPDRFHENGFAYICRDGTTRRWLCHGFMAIKDTIRNKTANSSGGDRLSHAVGCAFSVCLEKKQKRERENVSIESGPNNSFTRFGSFRQASITERLEDPQSVIPPPPPPPPSSTSTSVNNQTPVVKKFDNQFAIERPKGNQDILNRQNSLRGTSPFKRQTAQYSSLKPAELPSIQQQKNSFIEQIIPEESISSPPQPLISLQPQPSQLPINSKSTTDELFEFTFNTPPPQPQAQQWNAQFTTTTQMPPPLPPYPIPYPTPPPTILSSQSIQRVTSSSIYSTPSTTNQQETFEAKWARIQANKKTTNPFAEDIAKKFEIKL